MRILHVARILLPTVIGVCVLAGCSGHPGPEQPVPADERPHDSSTPRFWRPEPGASWQYQLSGPVDLRARASAYDIDLEFTTRATLRRIRARGAHAICYFSAGSVEEFRSDAALVPPRVIGRSLAGWPDERWLDIRQTRVLLPIMEKRIETCRRRGFEAVEPDNLDGFANATGFALSAGDQLRYNKAIAALAHRHGLSVGLKNDVDQARALEKHFDFAVNEECLAYQECGAYRPFIRAGKAVLHVEYDPDPGFCGDASIRAFSSIKKRRDLDAFRRTC